MTNSDREMLCASAKVVAAVLSFLAMANAQGTRLDKDPVAGQTSSCRPRIAGGSNSTLHMVWRDFRNSRWQIFYRRGPNFGTPPLPLNDVLLSGTTGDAWEPRVTTVTLSAGGHNVYVIWRELAAPGDERIYFRRSTDDGQTWSGSPILLLSPPNTEYASDPEIAADGAGYVYVLWAANVNAAIGDALYYRRLSNGGATLGSVIVATPITLLSEIPDANIVTDGMGNVYVAYIRYSSPSPPAQLEFLASNDNGLNWPWYNYKVLVAGAPTELQISASFSNPTTAHIHVVWVEGNKKVISRHNTKAGLSTTPPDYWSAPLTVDSTISTHEFLFGLDLASDSSHTAYVTFTKVRHFPNQEPAGTTSNAVVSCRSTGVWKPLEYASSAVLRPTALGGWSPTRSQIALAGPTANPTVNVVWMEESHINGVYTALRHRYTNNLKSSPVIWSSTTDLNGIHSTATRAAFPHLFVEQARAAVVWDERRFWTDPTQSPPPPVLVHGAPESFLRILTTN